MRNRRHASSGDSLEEGGIDMTPLIDVIFVVLILFILIAPMLEIDKIQLAAGPHREESPATAYGQDQPLVIKVTKDNQVLVNKLPVALESLPRLFQAMHARDPKMTPQLLQDKLSHFGTYQVVKNALEDAGFSELDVILTPNRS